MIRWEDSKHKNDRILSEAWVGDWRIGEIQALYTGVGCRWRMADPMGAKNTDNAYSISLIETVKSNMELAFEHWLDEHGLAWKEQP